MKKLFSITFFCLLALAARAQPGITEMQEAQDSLSTSFFSALNCSLVLAGILSFIGAIKIYYHWQMGEKQVTMAIAAWFFAAVFILLSGAFLTALFGI